MMPLEVLWSVEGSEVQHVQRIVYAGGRKCWPVDAPVRVAGNGRQSNLVGATSVPLAMRGTVVGGGGTPSGEPASSRAEDLDLAAAGIPKGGFVASGRAAAPCCVLAMMKVLTSGGSTKSLRPSGSVSPSDWRPFTSPAWWHVKHEWARGGCGAAIKEALGTLGERIELPTVGERKVVGRINVIALLAQARTGCPNRTFRGIKPPPMCRYTPANTLSPVSL